MASPVLKKLVRTISSPWLGVGLGGLTVIYLCVASVIPERLAGLLGVRDENIFHHWLVVCLVAAAILNMILSSVLRLKLNLSHLGGWLAHAGTIALAAGACWFAIGSQQGQAVSVKVPRLNFWTAMDSFYLPNTFACHINAHVPGSRPRQTPLPIDDPQKKQTFDVPLAGLPDGVTAKAVEYLPDAVMADYILLRIDRIAAATSASPTQSEPTVAQQVELSAVNRQFEADGFYILYHPDMPQNDFEEFLEATSPSGFSKDVLLVITGSEGLPVAAAVRPDGKKEVHQLNAGRQAELQIAGERFRLELLTRGMKVLAGQPSHMAANLTRGPALAVELQSTDSTARVWQSRIAVPFSQFQHISLPSTISLAEGRSAELSFAQASLPLPKQISIENANYVTYSGTEVPKDYICNLRIGRGESTMRENLRLNHPIMVGQYQVSQGAWLDDPREPMMIVLEVSSRPGLWLVWLGMAIIVVGLAWLVMVKPLLPGGRDAAS